MCRQTRRRENARRARGRYREQVSAEDATHAILTSAAASNQIVRSRQESRDFLRRSPAARRAFLEPLHLRPCHADFIVQKSMCFNTSCAFCCSLCSWTENEPPERKTWLIGYLRGVSMAFSTGGRPPPSWEAMTRTAWLRNISGGVNALDLSFYCRCARDCVGLHNEAVSWFQSAHAINNHAFCNGGKLLVVGRRHANHSTRNGLHNLDGNRRGRRFSCWNCIFG